MAPRIRAALAIVILALGVLLASFTSQAPHCVVDSPDLYVPYVPPKGYVCYRAEQVMVIDGRIDEAAWNAVQWTEDFVDIEGGDKSTPRFRTRVKMLWDDQNLYIAAELEEPHVQASMKKHDSYIFHDDNDFEIFIDPDGDNHLYAELEMNALNTTWDLLLIKPYRDGGPAIDAWEIPGLRTAVHVNGTLNDCSDIDRSWTIEVAWPWSSLKEISSQQVPPREGDQMRVNFSRVEWQFEVEKGVYRQVRGKKEENWVWSPQGAINMHMPERWGYVQFSRAKPGSESFQPDPAAPARHELQRIYDAQTRYHTQHNNWARTLKELGFSQTIGSRSRDARLETTEQGYLASIEACLPGGGKERWYISQDSRVWKK